MFLHGKRIYIRTFTLHVDEAPLSILNANSSLSDRYCSVKIVVGKHTRIQFDPDPNPGRILWMEQSHGNFPCQARYVLKYTLRRLPVWPIPATGILMAASKQSLLQKPTPEIEWWFFWNRNVFNLFLLRLLAWQEGSQVQDLEWWNLRSLPYLCQVKMSQPRLGSSTRLSPYHQRIWVNVWQGVCSTKDSGGMVCIVGEWVWNHIWCEVSMNFSGATQ